MTDLRGEEVPQAKLSDEAVREIRQRLQRGEPHRVIAVDHGVSRSLITRINGGLAWSHID